MLGPFAELFGAMLGGQLRSAKVQRLPDFAQKRTLHIGNDTQNRKSKASRISGLPRP